MASYRLLEIHARARAGMPDGWHVWLWKTSPCGGYHHLTGAVATPHQDGPHAGKPDWSRYDPATERQVVIPVHEHVRWCIQWSIRTGLCPDCAGDGQAPRAGRTANGGISPYSACRTCRGSGRARREAV